MAQKILFLVLKVEMLTSYTWCCYNCNNITLLKSFSGLSILLAFINHSQTHRHTINVVINTLAVSMVLNLLKPLNAKNG